MICSIKKISKKCGGIKPAVFLFSFFLIFYSCAYGEAGKDIEEVFVKKAERLGLSNAKYWHILLHYYNSITGIKSRIDDPQFFLSENGKKNPKQELNQCIRLFFSPDKEENRKYIKRFYARYKWLKKKLDPDSKYFEEVYCKEIEDIKPGVVSVIFPTYYMNNPASMFGHTLLTINTEYNNKRLSDAVNYAASTDTRNGVNFAIRGIFGFFKGYYSVMPYYEKIKQYSDINQRDMWEYRLNLRDEEVKKMIWHIRELNRIYTDYYFFDENCSFNLLYLIESARPEVNLVKRFKTVVIPIDTIKYMKEEKLIDGVDFRPSKTTLIKSRLEKFSKKEKHISKELINGELDNKYFLNLDINKDKKIELADLSVDIIQYLYFNEEMDKKTYKKNFLNLLKLRSKLGKNKDKKELNIKKPPRPDLGHDSKKISLGGGISDGDIFKELRLRPAFTDLTDMDYIKDKGAKIEFLDTRIRYYPSDDELILKQLDLIDISSIAPRDEIFKPLSWKFNTGFIRKTNHDLKESNVYQVNTGGGLSYKIFKSPFISYTFLEQQAEFGGILKNSYDLGAGVSIGILGTPFDFLKTDLGSRYLRFGFEDYHTRVESHFSANIKISKNNHLTIDYIHDFSRNDSSHEFSFSWNYFF